MTNNLSILPTTETNNNIISEERTTLRVVRGSGLEETTSYPSKAEQVKLTEKVHQTQYQLPEFIIPCFKPKKFETW